MPAEPYGQLDVRTERAATQFSTFLQTTLKRMSSLARGVAVAAVLIAVATYVTGLWSMDGSHRSTWVVLGAVLCAIPAVAGISAWLYVQRTATRTPKMVTEVRGLLGESKAALAMVIDHDSGQPLVTTARSLGNLQTVLAEAPSRYPSLRSAVRAATRVPGLVALTLLSSIVVGLIGTILLISGLVG